MPLRVSVQEAELRRNAPPTPAPTVGLVDESHTEQWSKKRAAAFAQGMEWACEQYGHTAYFPISKSCLCGENVKGEGA